MFLYPIVLWAGRPGPVKHMQLMQLNVVSGESYLSRNENIEMRHLLQHFARACTVTLIFRVRTLRLYSHAMSSGAKRIGARTV